MIQAWVRRTATLHGELSALAEVEPSWWLIAGGAAVTEKVKPSGGYMISDAEPTADTFIGYVVPARDVVRSAIARAHAARAAIRELDGKLPGQPLAVTVHRTAAGAVTQASELDVAAFAVGRRAWWVKLAARPEDERALADDLAAVIAGSAPTRVLAAPGAGPAPFVTVSLGEDAPSLARHGHRRGWHDERGAWLGLGRSDGMDTVSTCHMVVDGYGHTWIAGRVAHHAALLYDRAPSAGVTEAPAPSAMADATPLGVAWRPLPSSVRALPLAYALGRVLHRATGRPHAKFSPTLQIPIAPGRPDDPERRMRRVVQALTSVRFDRGQPEALGVFESRTQEVLAREASGRGLVSRLLAAAAGAPVPLVWKRRSVGLSRPKWLDRVADVVGGRGCLSKIRVDTPIPHACAVSSPARLATPLDPLGACVVTVIDDGERSAITVCGSGFVGTDRAAGEILDELMSLYPL